MAAPRKIAILAAGDFPSGPEAVTELRSADVLIACDGAAAAALEHSFTPDFIVGDGDSLPTGFIPSGETRLIRVSEQETNDLNKAFRFAETVAASDDGIVLLGATGKREDHMVGNISLLAEFSLRRGNVRMVTDHGVFYAFDRPRVFQTFPRQPLSFFNPWSAPAVISAEGVEYPLSGFSLRCWWSAALNAASGTELKIIEVESEGPLLLFAAFRGAV